MTATSNQTERIRPPKLFLGFLVLLLILFLFGFITGPLGTSLLGVQLLPASLTISKPHPQLPPEVIFHLFGFPVTNTILAAWLSILALVSLFYIGTRKMKLIPGRLQNLIEGIIEALLNFVESVAGKEQGRKFFPIVATIFLFVIMNAWLSLLPGFGSIFITGTEGKSYHLLRGANTDINVPLALAIMSFIFVEYWGITSRGLIRYSSKFINISRLLRGLGQTFKGKIKTGLNELFAGIIDLFVGFLEGISELVRLVGFTFRLFGNMTAGEILLLVTLFLVPLVMPLPFYGLEILIGFVQALIFAGLTLVFATVATQTGEH